MAKKLATGSRKAAMRGKEAATKRELIEAEDGRRIPGDSLARLGAKHEAEEPDASKPGVRRGQPRSPGVAKRPGRQRSS